MVHRRKGRKFNRTASHRRALLANLSIALILNKRIKTTEAKAKELRRFIEPLVTKAKRALKFQDSAPEKSIHLRREARKFLNNKEALIILFDEIGAKVGDRPGGFTRVLKTGNRYGDGARTAIIEFVDYNYIKEKTVKSDTAESTADGDDKKPKTKDKKKETKSVKTKEENKDTESKKNNAAEEKKVKESKAEKSADLDEKAEDLKEAVMEKTEEVKGKAEDVKEEVNEKAGEIEEKIESVKSKDEPVKENDEVKSESKENKEDN